MSVYPGVFRCPFPHGHIDGVYVLFFFCPEGPVPAVPALVVAGYGEVRCGRGGLQFLDVRVFEFGVEGGFPAVLTGGLEGVFVSFSFPGLDVFPAFGTVFTATVSTFPVPDYGDIVVIRSADFFYVRLFPFFTGELFSAFPAPCSSHIIGAEEELMTAGCEGGKQDYDCQGRIQPAPRGGSEQEKDLLNRKE